MKTKLFTKALFIGAALFLGACSGDSDGGDGGGNGNGNGNSVTSLTVSLSESMSTQCAIYQGDTVSFVVKDNNNTDRTSQATIMVNGNAINGSSYTTTSSGTHQVTATFQNVTSSALQVNVAEDELRFTKNLVIEDYTGTWCGYCPRVSHAIELVKQQTDRVAVVAIHSGDEYECSEVDQLEAAFGVSGYPTALLNRAYAWSYPEPNNVSQATGYIACNDAELGIAMTPSINGNNMSIDVQVKFNPNFSINSSTKLTVFILEDDLIADQANYTSYYGGADPIASFEHDHVLRASLTNVVGDAIPSADVSNGVYTKSFTAAIPSNVVNSSKMSVVAIVSNNNLVGEPVAINSRVAHFGDTQSFQEQ